MISHSAPVSGVAAYNNKYVATAGYDGKVILWDANRNRGLAIGHHDHFVNQCRFSPCGQYLVTTSSDYSARVWELPSLKLKYILNDHDDDVEGVSFHTTKPIFATSGRDEKINIYDMSGNLLKTLLGHTDDVITLQWISGEDKLLSSGHDGVIKLWDTNSGEVIKNIDLEDTEIDTVVATANGCFVGGDDRGNITLFNESQQASFNAHKSGIKRLIYSGELGKIGSMSYDGQLKIWEINDKELTLQNLGEYQLPPLVWGRYGDFLNPNKLIFSTFGTSYGIFDLKEEEWQFDHVDVTRGVGGLVKKSKDIYTVNDAGEILKNNSLIQKVIGVCNFVINFGDRVITGGHDRKLYDAITGELIYEHDDPLNCATVFNKNGVNHLIVGAYAGMGLIFKSEDNGPIEFVQSLRLHDNAVKGLTCSDKYIFSTCATGAVAWHSIEDFSLHKIDKKAHPIVANGCAAFGNGFVTTSRDLKIRVFDGDKLIKVLETPHSNSIKCICCDPEGKYIVSGGFTGKIYIYSKEEGKWYYYRPTNAAVSCIIFDKENSRFIASAYDGSTYPFSIADADVVN